MYKMLRKNEEDEMEVFYTENVQAKQLLDTERKKRRSLSAMVIKEGQRKQDLQQRQKLARDLRKIKQLKKEVPL